MPRRVTHITINRKHNTKHKYRYTQRTSIRCTICHVISFRLFNFINNQKLLQYNFIWIRFFPQFNQLVIILFDLFLNRFIKVFDMFLGKRKVCFIVLVSCIKLTIMLQCFIVNRRRPGIIKSDYFCLWLFYDSPIFHRIKQRYKKEPISMASLISCIKS